MVLGRPGLRQDHLLVFRLVFLEHLGLGREVVGVVEKGHDPGGIMVVGDVILHKERGDECPCPGLPGAGRRLWTLRARRAVPEEAAQVLLAQERLVREPALPQVRVALLVHQQVEDEDVVEADVVPDPVHLALLRPRGRGAQASLRQRQHGAVVPHQGPAEEPPGSGADRDDEDARLDLEVLAPPREAVDVAGVRQVPAAEDLDEVGEIQTGRELLELPVEGVVDGGVDVDPHEAGPVGELARGVRHRCDLPDERLPVHNRVRKRPDPVNPVEPVDQPVLRGQGLLEPADGVEDVHEAVGLRELAGLQRFPPVQLLPAVFVVQPQRVGAAFPPQAVLEVHTLPEPDVCRARRGHEHGLRLPAIVGALLTSAPHLRVDRQAAAAADPRPHPRPFGLHPREELPLVPVRVQARSLAIGGALVFVFSAPALAFVAASFAAVAAPLRAAVFALAALLVFAAVGLPFFAGGAAGESAAVLVDASRAWASLSGGPGGLGGSERAVAAAEAEEAAEAEVDEVVVRIEVYCETIAIATKAAKVARKGVLIAC
eukprot:CAMPEP_0114529546 /NCGR_PEP_ID=MMETSP0109-20121206/24908_1 /TAXON_ID=29199 /ORGANISM="Chlorarachnion reptans, Strain CCCM449" /LENGTH=543 /DNA_ID=CAMNT_0001711987 /DNA_START=357 /DNA_END=1989 /DNA_ORIENTATION=+